MRAGLVFLSEGASECVAPLRSQAKPIGESESAQVRGTWDQKAVIGQQDSSH